MLHDRNFSTSAEFEPSAFTIDASSRIQRVRPRATQSNSRIARLRLRLSRSQQPAFRNQARPDRRQRQRCHERESPKHRFHRDRQRKNPGRRVPPPHRGNLSPARPERRHSARPLAIAPSASRRDTSRRLAPRPRRRPRLASPPIATKFGRRLQRLGWIRDDTWTPYCKKLDAPATK
jgi:hypothetical protein